MAQSTLVSPSAGYLLDREELIRIRSLKLLTSDRDYVFFALQIDFPGKLNPSVDVEAFCERWELSDGNLYKALGELRNKGIVVSIASQLNLEFQPS
ncbi:hypothetical protein H6F93_09450 [Leptolyngbya sp. FACHB-671]|uniref:hypothetical protein n=1 Tax=Leptolyngbya sp. FACHB-671 TaxID=2692812 RepID=UPI001682DDD2|nr:hypothetical protein [Leptolyngbya sp. FACHB-671]MBD2067751.1 hypothetical protein [Leptolyngbya sp. FACHB-671]